MTTGYSYRELTTLVMDKAGPVKAFSFYYDIMEGERREWGSKEKK